MLTVLTKPILAVLLSSYVASTDAPAASTSQSGIAKFYSQGVFQQVAARRNIPMRRDVHGYAAVPNCARIGQVVWARLNGGPIERYHILDCSSPKDLPNHRREGLVIEVDFESARRNGFTREGHTQAVVYYP
ncbi:MAG: hypothetical protein ACJ78Q_21260 [Chloroflexia bacterium]